MRCQTAASRVLILVTAFATLRWGEVTALRRVRTVAIPEAIRPEIVKHLMTYVGPAPDALIFTSPKGAVLRRGTFNTLVRWVETVKKLGAPGLHFHDLRHTGNLLAAQNGASTKDLMARMGHDDMPAALIYQRATSEADQRIADRLSGLVEQHQKKRPDDPDDGASGVLVPVG